MFLYVAVGAFLVPFYCQWLPYSWYYSYGNSDQNQKIIEAENNKRVEAATDLLKSLNDTEVYSSLTSPHRTAGSLDFCFVIVTVSRPVKTYFLTQVVSSLLLQVKKDESSIMAIYNAEGATHKEAMSLSNIVPVISNKKKGILRSSFDKAREDYVFALQWCNVRKAKFSVIVEDDALPPEDFIFRLKFILNNRMNTDKKNWAILKLFYPKKYQGWGNDFNLIAELLGLSIVGGIILTVLFYFCECFVGKSRQFSWLLLICSILFTMYLFLSTGRPHWLAVRKVNVHLSSVVMAPGCCTQANLYPHTHVERLIKYLKGVQCNKLFPIDLALDRFVDSNGLQKLLVVPNLVKHIGFVSSLPGKGWKKSKEFLSVK